MSDELSSENQYTFDNEVSAWLDSPEVGNTVQESHDENLQWIGSFLTGDFDDEWGQETLASVA